MKLKTSTAAILFPDSRHSLKSMEDTTGYLNGKVNMLEFYYEGENDSAVGRLLEKNDLEGIFIGVIPLKERGLNLCSLDEENRTAAVQLMFKCIERTRLTGCHSLMLCSGKRPMSDSDIPACADAFVRSVQQIMEYEAAGSGSPVKLLLEPCDSSMDVKHLLGPTHRVIDTAKRISNLPGSFGLTMDTAHVAEEHEDFMEAMSAARPYCNHVHFANCAVQDPADPFYGDKHVGFDYPGGSFPYSALEKIFRSLEHMYKDDSLSIALEILCRADNPYKNFDAIMANMPWFFNYSA